jgi:hypothetical protein
MNDTNTQQAPCRNLRSHDMYFHGAEAAGFDYSSGSYWCLCTQQTTGPDGRVVDAQECNSVRTCFKG